LKPLQKLITTIKHDPNSESAIDLHYVENLRDWEELQGKDPNPNGITFNEGQICVKDKPDVPVTNHRCIAHEFGHVLIGPDHQPDSLRLMASGEKGTNLTEDEIKTARVRATKFFS